ncbi:UNKNOWN [Stylonychia lemnae]|uniref:Morn repeat protein n=1 Tax=Stylonychia lemnae TaxID=5949 RepID=A0A078AFD6_STYLE|nr:UNKNOWN [Stylonychia lemnae]|eukprot:CDW80566.1 UNKNOWN [Stylonychia lemnae]
MKPISIPNTHTQENVKQSVQVKKPDNQLIQSQQFQKKSNNNLSNSKQMQQSQQSQQVPDMVKKLKSVVKIQAKVKRKYFTQMEFWETLTRKKKYIANRERKYLEYTYKCSGALYKGEWKGGFRDGYGIIRWPDGAQYDGEWQDNRAHGYGKFVHAIGDIYEGQWKRDKACGKGIYNSVNSGGTYNGEWQNDLQHGRGLETWLAGGSYDGEFVMGQKTGLGKQIWPDGSVFVGYWENDMINGIVNISYQKFQGRNQWNDKRQYEGEFLNNLMHGFGKFTFSDGKTYEGFYMNDKKHGYGIFTWLNGMKYEGWWSDGKQDGYGILIDKTKKQFGLWKDGQKIKKFNEEEAKIVLRQHDICESQYKLQNQRDHIINDQQIIERMTFYSPSRFQSKQKEVYKTLDYIDSQFKCIFIEEQE